MEGTSITAEGVIDTFLVLLIGIGPKLALVPYVEITASLDATTKRRVQRQMLLTAGTAALLLIALGEVLRGLLHFSFASLRIAGGASLLTQEVVMVLAPSGGGDEVIAGRPPLQLARFPLPFPSLLNPVRI